MVAMVIAVDMVMEVTDMDVDTMARGKLLLKLMLNQDTSEVMEVTDMDVDTMERGRNQEICNVRNTVSCNRIL